MVSLPENSLLNTTAWAAVSPTKKKQYNFIIENININEKMSQIIIKIRSLNRDISWELCHFY